MNFLEGLCQATVIQYYKPTDSGDPPPFLYVHCHRRHRTRVLAPPLPPNRARPSSGQMRRLL
jgi:hypothetical protein